MDNVKLQKKVSFNLFYSKPLKKYKQWNTGFQNPLPSILPYHYNDCKPGSRK